MSLECSCIKQAGGLAQAVGGIVRAKLSCSPAAIASKVLIGVGSISPNASRERNFSSILEGIGDITTALTADYAVKQLLQGVGEIKAHASLNANLAATPTTSSSFISSYTDKFAGSFNDFGCNQKLYPIADVITSLSGNFFVDKTNNASGIYQSIDEGIFTGTYHTQGGLSFRIADDRSTYIHPSSVYTNGSFRYKCEVTPPTATPKESRLYIRASAPMANYFSDVAPEFTITDITLEDPSGNLIIQYDDIKLRGDSNYYDINDTNFTTYGTAPKINKLLLHTWEDGYPFMQDASGYTLNMNFTAKCLDDPFDIGFNVGYEDTCAEYVSSADSDDYLALDGAPLSTQTQNLTTNPTHSIRISAIEICDSGAHNTLNENFIPLYMEVLPSGYRIERCILPQVMPVYGFDTSVYPTVSSVWVGDNDYYSNLTVDGSKHLINKLRDQGDDDTHIVLDSTGPIADSGKLVLRFGHEQSGPSWELRNGAFSIGIPTTGAFDTAYTDKVESANNFFTVDSLVLRVRAKKSSGSRDYALDVVGYSDDKVLNITSAVGGFLQNTSGVGDMPASSGFNPVDDFALAGESLSDKGQYFEASGTNNDGGDHYKLSAPIVSGTDFEWYDVPLSVYDDNVSIGKSTDYSMSSYFEHLYLDIYPLPSGATIASIQLCVKYKPSNALQLHTVGYEKIARIAKDRGEGKIYPSSRQSTDSILNAGPSYAALSKIEDIPQAFTTPTTIKSNYSRRWRGLEGTVDGPFDPDEFGFGFENPLVDYAFTSGFYKFDTDNGFDIIPLVGTLSGTLTTSFSSYRFTNLGWRFKSDNLFADQLAGYTSDYTTTDWTALSNGGLNFESHELYGQIADAFTSVVRISGDNSYINFGDIDIADEFGLYIRFTPDVTISGATHDLFQSGVLFSKWDAGSDLEFTLGYDDNKLCFSARNSVGDLVTVKDTVNYDQYQYPLSVFVSHSNSSGTKLYTDNEISSGTFNVLRASSDPYTLATGSSNFIVGHSFGSGVGMNMFVSEVGISDRANFVYENADWTDKEVTVQEFLENNRVNFWDSTELYTDDDYKLWDRVNEDTLQWDLGAFKYCEFNYEYDGWTKRSGKDLITFSVSHNGSGYIDVTDKAMPSNLDSGVAYHTQIENDFLRFNLSDASDNFHSTDVRITKALPRGYHFSERALVVETVVNNKTFSNIVWADGNVGPKLIVSLYSRNQDPKTYEKENWGLINRAIHYIESSGCMVRLDSTFDYDNLIDESEAWALFPPERTLTDFEHKYYATDIDQMFLQYDLVYPSGEPFDSRIDIHSAHIRLEDAFVKATENSNGVPSGLVLNVSGEQRPREELSLFAGGVGLVGYPSGTLNLYVDANVTPLSGILNIYTFGVVAKRASLPLHLASFVSIGTGSGGGMPSGFNLYTSGNNRPSEEMPLYLQNTQTVNIPGGETLHLNTFGGKGAFSYMPAFLHSSSYSKDKKSYPASVGMLAKGSDKLQSDYADSYFNLFTMAPLTPTGSINLILHGDPDNYAPLVAEGRGSGSLGLYVTNYGASGSPALYWSSRTLGKEIDVSDNSYAALSADDEIRGVDLICYGDCDGSGNVKCEDKRLYTHDTLWRPSTCVGGGIFRALDTYTNLEVSGFNTSVGYSGHYYGIRKYDSLIPGMAYSITVEGETGANNHIKLPREWEEWEYGTTDDINFSGFKFIGDYPLLSGTTPVASGRNENDRYGHSVAVKKDIMAVSAPNHGYGIDGESYLEEAGAIFVYRRKDMVGSGDKAFWDLESKVVVPSAFRGDYSVRKSGTISFGGLPSIPVNQWYAGQKGRHLGHSVDISISGGSPSLGEDHKEVLVAGAPDSSWSRDFDGIVTSGIQVGVILFTDEFKYTGDKGNQIKNKVTQTNFIYRYYASPAVHLDLKVVVCQPTGIFGNNSQAGNVQLADFIVHKKIGRKRGATDEAVLSGIKSAFHEAFPYDATKAHNNIPPILGMYADNSRSLGRSDLEPAIDQFKQYYNNYSFLSGVKDWYGVQDSGHLYEFVPTGGASEDWVAMSKTIIDNLLDTGRLVSDDGMRFVTSGIGLEFANPAASEFNSPAASGGRVYIFEKESGHWNLIQEIKSPTPLEGSEGEFDGQDNLGGDGGEPVAPGGGGDGFDDDAGDGDLGSGAGEGSLGDDSSDEDDTETEIFAGNTQPDAFGHAVAISNNSEIITIGSPYMSENTCLAYEYNSKEKTRLYNNIESWLKYRNDGGLYDDALATFDDNLSAHGKLIAAQIAYLDLSASDKFYVRSDKNYWDNHNGIIQEYKQIFSYGYNDIAHTGTWQFIPGEFAPTSRLGFSTAVDEGGDILAFGAPTDSFNEFDDTNIYYKGYNTWSSYVNAGAVRIFESRKSTPHSGVIEFFKFGNLGMNTGEEAANYNDLQTIFDNSNRPFRRTEFAELEIDDNVGLAFIITPEIDAASDEVIDNIKNWMSLGDRTLVLVGDDPLWEGDGKYEESNKIINKILSKLDSKLRLHPARSEYESLPSCSVDVCVKYQVPTDIGTGPFAVSGLDVQYELTGWYYPVYTESGVPIEAGSGVHAHSLQGYPGITFFMPQAAMNHGQTTDGGYTRFPPSGSLTCLEFEDRPNLIASFVPTSSKDTDIATPAMFARGVADIKMHMPEYNVPSPCDDNNTRCELWLKDEGDLRAEWVEECVNKKGQLNRYKRNWPWDFGSAPNICEQDSFPVNRPGEEPRPLLVAAEYISGYIINYPSWDEAVEKPVYKTRVIGVGDNTVKYSFADEHVDEIDFLWSEASGNQISEDVANFFDPEAFEDRDSLIQATGQLKDDDPPVRKEKIVYDACIMAATENYTSGGNVSKVVIIAAVTPENESNMTAGFDHNVSFYENLVMKDCATKGSIMQIGGWTGRTSFTDAYSESVLADLFFFKGNSVEENWTSPLLSSHNICWVACPAGLPSDAELSEIKAWLSLGDKTLVMTYPDEYPSMNESYYGTDGWKPPDQDIARNVFNLCNMLELDMRPIYLTGRAKFATRKEDSDLTQGNKITLNTASMIIKGCQDNHTVKTFYAGRAAPHVDPKRDANFIPLTMQSAGTRIVTYPNDIKDVYYTPASPIWQIKSSIAEIKVPVVPDSGYRVFWNWVSEVPGENREVKIWLDDMKEDPNPNTTFKKIPILDYDKDDKPYIFSSGVISKKIESQAVYGRMYEGHVDVRAKEGISEISIFFGANDLRAGSTADIDYVPKTLRIFSVSGLLLPIDETIYIGPPISEEYIDHYETTFIHHPASSVLVPTQLRPIMTSNTKYCSASVEDTCKGYGGQLIADGPMVAAEEPEHFSSFKAGRKRSTIVVISDASILQGDCPEYRNSTSPNVSFIKSLYPISMDVVSDGGLSPGQGAGSSLDDGTDIQNKVGGRQFKLTQKLLAPERGSPHKYYAASGLSGLKSRFAGSSYTTVPSLSFFTDEESLLNPLDVLREKDPKPPLEPYIEAFENLPDGHIPSAGAYSKFSGVIDGKTYTDIGPGGGMPEIMTDTGSDFLDFEFFISGYPGDLFGYSISMHSGKLIVGTPFNGFVGDSVIGWDDVVAGSSPPTIVSGIKVSHRGGGGAAFYFERTELGSGAQGEYLPWEFKQKIKPSGVNVGHDDYDTLGSDLIGNNNYAADDFLTMLSTPDRFGHAVSLDADFAAVGAPGHDYGNIHEHVYASGAFLRKEFDFEFDIPLHNVYDMGTSGMRDTFSGSGNPVLNNGAVFTLEHRIVDWPTRTKSWVVAEKVVAQGYNSRLQKSYSGPSEIPVSGAENDHFGETVSINRARRDDGDYTLAVGARHHMFATSGDHLGVQPLPEAGAAYTFDAMLREQPPSLGSPDNWIQASIFGDALLDTDRVNLSMYQDTDGSTKYTATGVVWSNDDGEIFLEASGYDPSTKGFIENRSYITLVYGDAVYGTPVASQMGLYSFGSAPITSSNMPLHIAGPDSNTVYNSVGLYTTSAYFASGDMPLYIGGASGIADSGQLWLHTSGTAFNNEQLNLRIRGK
jgi:hypothetical protein